MGWWSLACCSPSHGRRYRSMAQVAVTGGRTQTPSTGLRHPSFFPSRRKVPESGAWSVGQTPTPSTGLRHPSFLRGGRCRKAVLGVWVELQLQALVYDILPSFLRGGRCRKAVLGVWVELQLQALVYDILPSTTAVFRCAIGSRKLLANEQFFVGAQAVVSLLQTTRIISDVCQFQYN